MPPIWRLALNILAGRRGRTAFLIGATVLSTSLVMAVACALGSAHASLEYGLARFIGSADARIIHPAGGRFGAELLEEIRAWPEVEVAAGRFGASITLVRADREVDPTHGRPRRVTPNALGVVFPLEEQVRRLEIDAGSRPETADGIVIDPLTAEALRAGVGDALEILRIGEPPVPIRVTGIFRRQKLGSLQRPLVYMDRAAVGEVTGHRGELTSIYVVLADGADPEAFCAERAGAIPEALTLEPAERVRTGMDQRVRANRLALTIASVLTFLCAGFIILTGLTTGVTEREREMALLRALGARRMQLFGSQMLVGAVYGIVGALLGIPLGALLARALVAMYSEFLPAGFSILPMGVVLSATGALAAGMLGALYPAIVVSRVPPLRAIARQARPVRAGPVLACTGVALGLIAFQVALGTIGDRDAWFWMYAGLGLPALFIGWFLLGVPALFIVTYVLAPVLACVLRLPADMFRRSALATPFRHGLVCGALMVGPALLVDAYSGGVAFQKDWLERVRFADGFASRRSGIPPDQQAAIANLPCVDEVCPIGYLPARLVSGAVFGVDALGPRNVVCVGFDPERFFSMNAIEWIQGDPATAIPRIASGDGLIVAERFLVARDIGVGDRITLGVGRVVQEFEIVGVVAAGGLELATQLFGVRSQYMEVAMSCVFLDHETVGRLWDNRDAYLLQVNLNDSVSDEEATLAINEAVPGVNFQSGRWVADTVNELAGTLMRMQSTVAFAALLLASLAVGNVVAANVRSRRFEYGVLRAVGMPRGGLVRLVLGEVALLAITGALIGTCFGLHLAWMDARLMRELAGIAITPAVPPIPIAIGWITVVVVTIGVALPSTISLVRKGPGPMLAAGRNE